MNWGDNLEDVGQMDLMLIASIMSSSILSKFKVPQINPMFTASIMNSSILTKFKVPKIAPYNSTMASMNTWRITGNRNITTHRQKYFLA